MSENPELNDRVLTLEVKLDALIRQVESPPKKPLWQRALSWDMLKNIMVIVGIPAAGYAAYQTLDEQLINQKAFEKRARLEIAIDQIDELQSFNEGVFVQQALSNDSVAFAKIEAKRGRVERLTKDLYDFWTDYPDEFTRSEKTTLVEALITLEQNDMALKVVDSVDQSGFNLIWQGDMDLLKSRVLFARGPSHDPEAARDAFRAAMEHAQAHEDPGVGAGLMEKYVGVRLLNEMWLGRDCADLVPFAGYLGDMMQDGTPPEAEDSIRAVTRVVMQAHARQCPPA